MRKLSALIALIVAVAWIVTPRTADATTPLAAAARRSVCASQVATDDFARADGTLGANWTDLQGGSPTFLIVSQKVAASGVVTDDIAFWNANSFNNEHCSLITVDPKGTTGYQGVGVRLQAGSSDANGYGIFCGTNDFYKFVNGTRSDIGDWTGTCATNDTLELKATGTTTTTLELFLNGSSVGTATDSSSAITGGKPGLHSYPDGLGTLDNWVGSDVASGATSFVPALINSPVRGGGFMRWLVGMR